MCLDTLSLVNIGWVRPQGHHIKGACRAFWAVFARSCAENRHKRGKPTKDGADASTACAPSLRQWEIQTHRKRDSYIREGV